MDLRRFSHLNSDPYDAEKSITTKVKIVTRFKANLSQPLQLTDNNIAFDRKPEGDTSTKLFRIKCGLKLQGVVVA